MIDKNRERDEECALIGWLGCYDLDIMNRVYSTDGPAPTCHTKNKDFPYILIMRDKE